jgi:hypothetical protein
VAGLAGGTGTGTLNTTNSTSLSRKASVLPCRQSFNQLFLSLILTILVFPLDKLTGVTHTQVDTRYEDPVTPAALTALMGTSLPAPASATPSSTPSGKRKGGDKKAQAAAAAAKPAVKVGGRHEPRVQRRQSYLMFYRTDGSSVHHLPSLCEGHSTGWSLCLHATADTLLTTG